MNQPACFTLFDLLKSRAVLDCNFVMITRQNNGSGAFQGQESIN